VPDTETCKSICAADPSCSTWTLQAGGSCYTGAAEYCYDPSQPVPEKAQRLFHGEVVVLKSLRGFEVTNLRRIFGPGHFMNLSAAVEHCRSACYSNVKCQFWQYAEDGCYLETPDSGYSVSYPLTTDNLKLGTQFAETVVAGEFIQHYCPGFHPERWPQSLFEVSDSLDSAQDSVAVLSIMAVVSLGVAGFAIGHRRQRSFPSASYDSMEGVAVEGVIFLDDLE
jgi:hypothetical protein